MRIKMRMILSFALQFQLHLTHRKITVSLTNRELTASDRERMDSTVFPAEEITFNTGILTQDEIVKEDV